MIRILFIVSLLLLLGAVTQAETIDDKVFLQGHMTGETNPLGLEVALAAPPFYPIPKLWILPVYYQVREPQRLNSVDTVGIMHVEPGIIATYTLSPRFDILVTQNLNWRKISDADFSWKKEITASGVYTLAYYPRDDQRYFYLLGVTLTNDGYRNQLLPALAVVYESEDGSKYFELGAPYSNLLLRPWEKWELGLAVQLRAAYYHLPDAKLSGQDSRAEYLNLFSVSAGPAIGHELTENIWAHLKFGAEFLRSMEQWDANFREIAGTRVQSPATWYVKLGVGLRFPDERKRSSD